MSKKKRTSIRKRIDAWGGTLFTLFFRGIIVVAIFTLLYLVFKGYQDDRYIIQSFQVPTTFENNGVNGVVLARKIQDEVQTLKDDLFVAKADSLEFGAENAPDLQVELMGVGLSVNSITYHIKNLFGRENHIITGELVDLGTQLEMTLRMTGFDPKVHRVAYGEDKTTAYDSLLTLSAMSIIRNTDPYRIAVYYIEKGENQKALRLIMGLIARNRDVPWAYVAWGQLLQNQDQRREADIKFTKAIELDSELSSAYKYRAWNNFARRDYAAAKKDFEKCLHLNSDDYNAWNGIGQCLRGMGKYDEALEVFNDLIEENPENIWWYTNVAYIYERHLKDTLGAINMYQRAEANAKDGVAKYTTLANYYRTVNKQDSAILYLKKSLEISPNYSNGLIQLLNYYYDLNEFTEARKYAKGLIATNPTKGWDPYFHKISAYNLSAMMDYKEKKYDSAKANIDKAIAMDPSLNYPYTTLAEIYGFQGKMDQFYDALNMALERQFPLEALIEESPYNQFVHQPRFQAIIKKYYKDRDTVVPKTVAENN